MGMVYWMAAFLNGSIAEWLGLTPIMTSLVAAPLIEELLFKAGIVAHWQRQPWLRAAVSCSGALVFALIEQVYKTYPSHISAAVMVIAMHVAVALIGAKWRWAGLIVSVLMHSAWNYMAFVLIHDKASIVQYAISVPWLVGYVAIAWKVWRR
mgnify:CR=1 FL=1